MKIGMDGGAKGLVEGSYLVGFWHRILPQLELSQRPPAPVLCAILQPRDHSDCSYTVSSQRKYNTYYVSLGLGLIN